MQAAQKIVDQFEEETKKTRIYIHDYRTKNKILYHYVKEVSINKNKILFYTHEKKPWEIEISNGTSDSIDTLNTFLTKQNYQFIFEKSYEENGCVDSIIEYDNNSMYKKKYILDDTEKSLKTYMTTPCVYFELCPIQNTFVEDDKYSKTFLKNLHEDNTINFITIEKDNDEMNVFKHLKKQFNNFEDANNYTSIDFNTGIDKFSNRNFIVNDQHLGRVGTSMKRLKYTCFNSKNIKVNWKCFSLLKYGSSSSKFDVVDYLDNKNKIENYLKDDETIYYQFFNDNTEYIENNNIIFDYNYNHNHTKTKANYDLMESNERNNLDKIIMTFMNTSKTVRIVKYYDLIEKYNQYTESESKEIFVHRQTFVVNANILALTNLSNIITFEKAKDITLNDKDNSQNILHSSEIKGLYTKYFVFIKDSNDCKVCDKFIEAYNFKQNNSLKTIVSSEKNLSIENNEIETNLEAKFLKLVNGQIKAIKTVKNDGDGEVIYVIRRDEDYDKFIGEQFITITFENLIEFLKQTFYTKLEFEEKFVNYTQINNEKTYFLRELTKEKISSFEKIEKICYFDSNLSYLTFMKTQIENCFRKKNNLFYVNEDNISKIKITGVKIDENNNNIIIPYYKINRTRGITGGFGGYYYPYVLHPASFNAENLFKNFIKNLQDISINLQDNDIEAILSDDLFTKDKKSVKINEFNIIKEDTISCILYKNKINKDKNVEPSCITQVSTGHKPYKSFWF